jgi:hypothetical protein
MLDLPKHPDRLKRQPNVQARFDFVRRFLETRESARRCETDRALTMAEELEGLVKRDDLFLGRFPTPKPRELQLVQDILRELGELSDDRLYGDITEEAILHAVEQVGAAWQLFTDASSGFFIQPRPEAG